MRMLEEGRKEYVNSRRAVGRERGGGGGGRSCTRVSHYYSPLPVSAVRSRPVLSSAEQSSPQLSPAQCSEVYEKCESWQKQ